MTPQLPFEAETRPRERADRTDSFRSWLLDRIAHDARSLHAIEVAAGIRGNALGKFLRGERGRIQSLTPMHIQRLAPVLRIGEVELLYRAGHLSYEPAREPLEMSILASESLDDDAKLLMLELYTRLRPTAANLALRRGIDDVY